jgi:hypothetical protein
MSGATRSEVAGRLHPVAVISSIDAPDGAFARRRAAREGGSEPMMILRSYKSAAFAAAVVGVGLSAFVGCGGDDLPRRYPVYGTVTYKGKPVESGTITFTPDDLNKGRSAGSAIKDGHYSLASLTTDDGAMAGHYKVTVVAQKMITDGMDPKLKTMYEKAISSPGVPIPPQAKKKVKIEDLVPKKYCDPKTSSLQAEVAEKRNEVNFDLPD